MQATVPGADGEVNSRTFYLPRRFSATENGGRPAWAPALGAPTMQPCPTDSCASSPSPCSRRPSPPPRSPPPIRRCPARRSSSAARAASGRSARRRTANSDSDGQRRQRHRTLRRLHHDCARHRRRRLAPRRRPRQPDRGVTIADRVGLGRAARRRVRRAGRDQRRRLGRVLHLGRPQSRARSHGRHHPHLRTHARDRCARRRRPRHRAPCSATSRPRTASSTPTATASRSRRMRPTSCPATTTATATSSSAISRPAPRPPPTRSTACWGTRAPTSPRSAPTASIVAFHSYSTTLLGAGGDTNGHGDIFTRALGPVQPGADQPRRRRAGAQPNGDAYSPSMSDNGQRVAFETNATNLGDGDADQIGDVHVRDVAPARRRSSAVRPAPPAPRATASRPPRRSPATAARSRSRATRRTSARSAPARSATTSARRSCSCARSARIRPPWPAAPPAPRARPTTAAPIDPSITANGTGVAYGAARRATSTRSRRGASTRSSSATWPPRRHGSCRAPLTHRGAPARSVSPSTAPDAISADGRYVAFTSSSDLGFGTVAGPLGYVRDTLTGATTLVTRASGADGAPAAVDDYRIEISADGTHVAFVSMSPRGRWRQPPRPGLRPRSAHRHHDARQRLLQRRRRRTARATPPSTRTATASRSGRATISPRGTATADRRLRPRPRRGTTTLASVAANGAARQRLRRGPASTSAPTARALAFTDTSDNLVGGDTNTSADVFVADLAAGTTTRRRHAAQRPDAEERARSKLDQRRRHARVVRGVRRVSCPGSSPPPARSTSATCRPAP